MADVTPMDETAAGFTKCPGANLPALKPERFVKGLPLREYNRQWRTRKAARAAEAGGEPAPEQAPPAEQPFIAIAESHPGLRVFRICPGAEGRSYFASEVARVEAPGVDQRALVRQLESIFL